MDRPLLSIIIPVYNQKNFVCRCLESVKNQDLENVQVIVVDDGSNDGSEKIVDEYKKDFEIYHLTHKGVSHARNHGLKKARGQFITFLDADDAYSSGAIAIMEKYTRHNLPIIQFGQFRAKCETSDVRMDRIRNQIYTLDKLPKRWTMVWNKIFRADVIEGLKFKETMQFGEDEIFVLEALLRVGELKHAPHPLVFHYFDDDNSLCRGGLSLKRLEGLIRALKALAKKQTDEKKKQVILDKIKTHEESPLFKRFGYGREANGHYDVVYCLKDTPTNEELRYSLRSVEENWQYRNVVFAGGCPNGLNPDYHMKAEQTAPTKWERVRGLLLKICDDENITEDFWLFNDDFFILKYIECETMPPLYNGNLRNYIKKVEERHNNEITVYTKRLRHLVETLEEAGKGLNNYAVHKPMLFNRKKLKALLEKFPNEPMTRALYGNYYEIGGESQHDMKVQLIHFPKLEKVKYIWPFISTSDSSFKSGNVGRFLRERFNEPSRFEEGK